MTELSKLLYHASSMALPLTTSRLLLITTACSAVVIDDKTPKMTPMGEVVLIAEPGARSRTTPVKKPRVTTPTEMKMRNDGRVCSMTEESTTVKGRTRPRAT